MFNAVRHKAFRFAIAGLAFVALTTSAIPQVSAQTGPVLHVATGGKETEGRPQR